MDERGRVELWSRRGNTLTGSFPEVTASLREVIPPATVLDGELVCWSAGRLDFGALLRRHGAGRRVSELAPFSSATTSPSTSSNWPRYHDLHAETVGSLAAAQIEVWWVHPDGTVSMP